LQSNRKFAYSVIPKIYRFWSSRTHFQILECPSSVLSNFPQIWSNLILILVWSYFRQKMFYAVPVPFLLISMCHCWTNGLFMGRQMQISWSGRWWSLPLFSKHQENVHKWAWSFCRVFVGRIMTCWLWNTAFLMQKGYSVLEDSGEMCGSWEGKSGNPFLQLSAVSSDFYY